jgi:hypothetical protein
MPTDTFTIATAADDGSGYYVSTNTWPPNPPAAGSTFVDEPGDLLIAVKEDNPAGPPDYYAEVCCMRWDTSSIPDAATITGVDLKLHLVSVTTTLTRNLVGDYFDFGGEPTVAADWILSANPSIFTAVDVASLTVGAVNTFALTDLTGISKTGFTGIRLTIDNNTSPVDNKSAARFASFEDPTNPAPQLVVTYTTLASVPVVRHAIGLGRW